MSMDVCAYFVGRRAYIKKHLERYLKYENVRVRYESERYRKLEYADKKEQKVKRKINNWV